jgi:hypothetical protein
MRNRAKNAIIRHLDTIGMERIVTTTKEVVFDDGRTETTTQIVRQPVEPNPSIVKMALFGGWETKEAYLEVKKLIIEHAKDGEDTASEKGNGRTVSQLFREGLGLKPRD